MEFTVQDRHLPPPTQRTSKVLHLATRESHRLTVAKYVTYNVSLDFSIKYNLQSEFTRLCPHTFLYKSDHFHRSYRRKQMSVFFIETLCTINWNSKWI